MNDLINKKVKFINLGAIDYQEAWDYQTGLFEEIISQKLANRDKELTQQDLTDNYLLFCQHPHVYTLGKSGNQDNLLIDEAGLKEKDATFYKINRGGDITYHGPGQLVGYPVIDLENFYTDIHRYMRNLEDAVIGTLANFGIEGERYDGLTGVWIQAKSPMARKICAIGVKTSRWVTMHGFAFNIDTDLSYFNNIVPCGIQDKAVTSLSRELGRKVEMAEVIPIMKEQLAAVFEMVLF